MSTVPFDTHAIVKTLQTRGFEVEQAEGITDALKDARTVAEIATKHDIKELREAT
jgi:ActR/RegA family two-component response regulator